MQTTRHQSRRLTIACTDCRDRRDRRDPVSSHQSSDLDQSGNDYWIVSYTSLRPCERVRHADSLLDELNSAATRDPDFAIPHGVSVNPHTDLRQSWDTGLCSTVSLVRRPKIRELAEQIAVWTYFVSRCLPVCENREEDIDGIVSECSAIVGKARRASRRAAIYAKATSAESASRS